MAGRNHDLPHRLPPAIPRRFRNGPTRTGFWDGIVMEADMDKEHAKGAAKDLKGKAKEAAGKATGSRKTEVEGKADQAEGKTRKAVGDVKDALKR
jgi:uncharacterized protein YjbJ (UPF0337 family)